MISRGWISFIILTSCPIFSLCQSEPVVKTPLGFILGTIETSRKGMNFYSFRGIRYAEPPVNNLRFKPPVPVKPWTDTFDATEDGPACMQKFSKNMSEDCLRLNVYTHNINDNKNLPVLVFIHGGEFDSFSGQSKELGPEYIMNHEIVVVTINYRLGTFGFFSTGDEHAPGNNGMKDQVQALKWVQNNIRAFGGDPNRVTIAGQSAGAASVILHLISPMSKDLFHRAIAVSGSSLNNWTITRDPLPIARQQAAILHCPSDDSQAMVNCMRELPPKNISNIIYELKGYRADDPIAPLTPVIESGNNENERFLSKCPLELIKEGKFANVPLMIGTTKDELSYRGLNLLYDEELVSKMSNDWNKIAPIIFYYEPNDVISKQIREFYLKSSDTPITNDSAVGLEQLYSDALIIHGVIETAKLVSDKSDKPVYLYQFNYERDWPRRSDHDPHRVGQYDDVELIFKTPFKPISNTSIEDNQFADKLAILWRNFIETGNPTVEASSVLDKVKWSPFKSTSPSYLNINKTLSMVEGLYYQERISFWEKLFPL